MNNIIISRDKDAEKIRTHIRKKACANRGCPIEIVKGRFSPRIVGRSYYFTNKRGDIIHHPSAYMNAWGKPIYHASTRRVEVGSSWVTKQKIAQKFLDKETIRNIVE